MRGCEHACVLGAVAAWRHQCCDVMMSLCTHGCSLEASYVAFLVFWVGGQVVVEGLAPNACRTVVVPHRTACAVTLCDVSDMVRSEGCESTDKPQYACQLSWQAVVVNSVLVHSVTLCEAAAAFSLDPLTHLLSEHISLLS